MCSLINTSVIDAKSTLECALANGQEMQVLALVNKTIPSLRGKEGQKSRLKMLCAMGRKALNQVEKGASL
jgi:hypothetical protein